jgi:transcriptional regulator with XRE-family HTH domain
MLQFNMYLCILLCMNKQNIKATSIRIALKAKSLGLTQLSIAEAIGADQSQVSRVLSGHSKRRSRVFDQVCNYVENSANGLSSDLVRNNDELIDALASVWDGSENQATTLASVIRSLGVLTVANTHHSSKTHKKGG